MSVQLLFFVDPHKHLTTCRNDSQVWQRVASQACKTCIISHALRISANKTPIAQSNWGLLSNHRTFPSQVLNSRSSFPESSVIKSRNLEPGRGRRAATNIASSANRSTCQLRQVHADTVHMDTVSVDCISHAMK